MKSKTLPYGSLERLNKEDEWETVGPDELKIGDFFRKKNEVRVCEVKSIDYPKNGKPKIHAIDIIPYLESESE